MKAKKVLAMLMASAMIMGTSVTAFAATPGYNQNQIKVENLGENATVTYLQIIKPDRTSATGWKFVNDTVQNAYVNAFNAVNKDTFTAEEVIWMLLEAKSPENANIPEEINAASADQIQAGVDAIEGLESESWVAMSVEGTTAIAEPVNEAGIYVIKAVDDTDDEIDYFYSGMAAYVSFEYNEDGSADTDVESATVNAKKTTMDISKSSDETDDVVGIGDTVTYTINTVVPYIKDNVANEDVVYYITDTLTGAEYDIDNNGDVTLKVKVGELGEEEEYKAPVMMMENEQQFIVDLSDIAENRANANQSLTITYQATVTGEVVNNTAQPGDGNHDYDEVTGDDTLYTGKITMTKYGEAGENEKLEGAEFVLYYEEDGKTYYAEFDEAENFVDNAHEYIFTGKWIAEKEEGVVPEDATHIVTDSDGEAVVRGLDDDATYNYKFKEVKAPEGYSINETDAAINEWTGDVDNKENTASMNDTKLSSLPLPSTGGIGTTLFTVGGCTIMVVAAGLYFASRKKEEN